MSQALFLAFCRSEKLPVPLCEYAFHPTRKWRFDYAWYFNRPSYKVALEVEGGIFSGGRHTRGKGFMADIDKYNEASLLGWTVVRCTPETLLTVKTIDMIKSLLELK